MAQPKPTYAWYANEFGGKLDRDSFESQLLNACFEITDMCMGRDVPKAHEDAYKAAICSVVEIYAESGYGPSAGFTVGSFSIQGGSDTTQDFARSHARKILFPTGLLYAGIG